MKESMMKNKVFVNIQMNKIYATCIIGAVAWCAAAQACSPPLDGSPANCPTTWPDKDIKLPRKELKGEVDIWNVNQIHQMQMMFLHNARQDKIENNMTQPSDAINNALDSFWEQEHGSNGSTKSEELL